MILHRTTIWCWPGFAALTLCVELAGGAVWAQDKPDARLLASAGLERLQEAVAQPTGGARYLLAKKELLALSPDKAMELLLGNNLALQQQRHLVESAKHGIQAAEASFLPTFNVSVTYRTNRSYERKESIGRMRERVKEWIKAYVDANGNILDAEGQEQAALAAQQAAEEGRNGPDYVWAYGDESGAINPSDQGLCVNVEDQAIQYPEENNPCQEDLEFRRQVEFASVDSLDWFKTWSATARVAKLFPWGGSVNGQVTTTLLPYKVTKAARVSALETALELGKNEWFSNATVGFRSPLPYTKNFGKEGNFYAVQADLARLNSERSELFRDSTQNTVLRNGMTAYWELVRSLLQVEVAERFRQTMASNLERGQRLFEQGRMTEYNLLQIRANLENARNEEEIAWNNVVVRENNLVELLNLPAKVVVAPEAYSQPLLTPVGVHGNDLLTRALQERPEILAARSDVQSQEMMLNFRKNQLLPDLVFNASVNVGQSTSVFAYGSMTDSWTNLASPDSMNYYLGFTLNIPWGNNKARSEYSQARASHTQALDNERLAEVRVAKEANSALASYRSAQSREKLSRTNLDLAQSALATAERQVELELITEFELLQRHLDLFVAQVGQVNALLDQQLALVNLQAASGELGKGVSGSPTKGGGP